MNPAFLAVDNLIADYNNVIEEIVGTDEKLFGSDEFTALVKRFQDDRKTLVLIRQILQNEGF